MSPSFSASASLRGLNLCDPYDSYDLYDQRGKKGNFMDSFESIPLPEQIRAGLRALSFSKPTEIQSVVIPIALEGRDLIACAQTGSGKTGAYGIPMVARLLAEPQKMGLILAPTRELAHQISEFMRELTVYCKDFRVTSLVGGAEFRKQVQALKRRPRIVVATPGRLIDHLKRRTLHLKSTSILVLDEGDRMLDMGFAPQLNEIVSFLPEQRQSSLFTATLPEKVRALAATYLAQPQHVNVGRTSQPVSTIRQSVVQVSVKEKDERIVDELNQRDGSIIIFLRTKHRTDVLARSLSSYGFAVDLIHGGRTQGQRNKALQNFKCGKSRILCATDVASRGIDIPQVEHVINFDLPLVSDDYVHRIGRTARNGASGEAVSFVTPADHGAWIALARKYKIPGVEIKGSRGEFRPHGERRTGFRQDRNSHGRRAKPPSRFGSGARRGPSARP